MDTLIACLIAISLGFDSLLVSASLGLRRSSKDGLRIALTFAAAEALMPIAGVVIGGAIGQYFQGAISVIGALLLIGVAIYFLFFDDDDDDDKAFKRPLSGWPLFAVAIGISLDELAVGLSAGMMRLPIVLTVVLLAVQAFAFALIGVKFGAGIKRYLGEWAEKASGAVLGLMGIWMLFESL
ncbi:manganese efflux pump MntP family protein [Cohnella sp. GCM10027633]|uniref:manganese efflux pump MntP n=1 Tax=unclassified Cohnella TaxID=2636738 RepID=UPI0036277620